MTSRPIILVGGGGHCQSVIEAAESAGMLIMGILDKPSVTQKNLFGYKLIGTDDDIERFSIFADFVITVGSIKNAELRRLLFNRIKKCGGSLRQVIASSAIVSRHAIIGEGTVILHQTLVNAGAQIGDNCIINSFAGIEHGSVVGNHTHVATRATINGDCRIGDCVFIGSGAVLHQECCVPDKSIIAAGSVVRNSLSCSGVYAGTPAHLI